ncbi:TrmH family RNA methyltransferase [bacterium]|nr:MAG: TrmH family RNA methyltransferase [bacterium]
MNIKSNGETRARDYFVRHELGTDRITVEEAQQQPRFPLYGILDNLRSAHNVGSIFRTSDGANISELAICGYSPTPPHRHLSKTAFGSVDVVPWRHFETVEEAIADYKAKGIFVAAIELSDTSSPLWEAELPFPVALVMGNEVDGLSPETQALCDATWHLPMMGHKNSLNVSVAWGIALYDVLRRFELGKSESDSGD